MTLEDVIGELTAAIVAKRKGLVKDGDPAYYGEAAEAIGPLIRRLQGNLTNAPVSLGALAVTKRLISATREEPTGNELNYVTGVYVQLAEMLEG